MLFSKEQGEWNKSNESKLKIKLLCHHPISEERIPYRRRTRAHLLQRFLYGGIF